MDEIYTVYALVDPRDYLTRYIGISTQTEYRYQQHLACHGKNIQKDAWVQELKALEIKPILRELETIKGFEQARGREDHWIRHYLDAGIELYQAVNFATPLDADPDIPVFYQEGVAVGRVRTDEQIREIILYRLEHGVWPDLNADMRSYYNKYYIKPTGKHYYKAQMWLREYHEITAS